MTKIRRTILALSVAAIVGGWAMIEANKAEIQQSSATMQGAGASGRLTRYEMGSANLELFFLGGVFMGCGAFVLVLAFPFRSFSPKDSK